MELLGKKEYLEPFLITTRQQKVWINSSAGGEREGQEEAPIFP